MIIAWSPTLTIKNKDEYIDINELMMREASDTLLFLSDSFTENKYNMQDMEFLVHIENACQDILYNITSVVRNLTNDIDTPDDEYA